MMISGRESSILWLTYALEANTRRFHALAEAFGGDIDAVYEAAATGALCHHPSVKPELADALASRANAAYLERCMAQLASSDIRAVTIVSEDYPKLLTNIYDPPAVLFSRGILMADIRLPIAVIGSRAPSDYGKRMAESLSYALSEGGACIVSGLAYGVDGIAARGALRSKANPYPTIAVLGSGVDMLYPKSNQRLYDEIIERGAVVSEYLPGTKAEKHFFPARNRLISGLSRGVLVVEAAQKSGTMITVDAALEQGRDVFAVPGRIGDFKSEGTNALIAEGAAKLILSADDVLGEYMQVNASAKEAPVVDEKALGFEQALIWRLLRAGEKSFDELAEMTGISAGSLNSALTEMELSGIIKQSPGRLYSA